MTSVVYKIFDKKTAGCGVTTLENKSIPQTEQTVS